MLLLTQVAQESVILHPKASRERRRVSALNLMAVGVGRR